MSRAGGRIRVTVQLIDGQTDGHLWSEHYDRELTAENVFEIRTDVARAVARALKATLTPDEDRRIALVPTTSLEAKDWVEIGNRRRAERRPSGEWAAAYRRALALDPSYAPAWSALAVAYFQMIQREGEPAEVYADSATWAADRALALDPEQAAAYSAKSVAAFFAGRIREAYDLARRATELDPGLASAWTARAAFASTLGDLIDALDGKRRAARIAPTSVSAWANLSGDYIRLGDYVRAEEALAIAAELDSLSRTVYYGGSQLAAYRGDVEEARALADLSLEVYAGSDRYRRLLWAANVASWQRDWRAVVSYASEALELSPDADLPGFEEHAVQTILAFGLQKTRGLEAALPLYEEMLEELQRLARQGSDWPSVYLELAAIQSALGRSDEAASALAQTYELGCRDHRWIELDPMFDNLRGHPTYERVLARMRADVAEARRRVLEMEAGLQEPRS